MSKKLDRRSFLKLLATATIAPVIPTFTENTNTIDDNEDNNDDFFESLYYMDTNENMHHLGNVNLYDVLDVLKPEDNIIGLLLMQRRGKRFVQVFATVAIEETL